MPLQRRRGMYQATILVMMTMRTSAGGLLAAPVDPLAFQPSERVLGHGIVVGVTHAAHRPHSERQFSVEIHRDELVRAALKLR